MKYVVADGWHTFYGVPVWVEDGRIMRTLIKVQNDYVSAYPYRQVNGKPYDYEKCIGISVYNFRKLFTQGKIIFR